MTTAKLPLVTQFNPYLGCDPEFFFKTDKEVIGAEKVFKKDGLDNTVKSVSGDICAMEGTKSKFIIDGVQAELNPRPNTCRANLANEISACFKTLKAELEKQKKEVKCDFSRSVEISKEKLAELDENNQKFGCMPSNSVYKNSGIKLADVDATKHRQRSAGGHIHIGHSEMHKLKEKIKDAPEDVVKMLDIICGNSCVLMDRDKGNKERRKLYGRAGEYRLPKHGIEYRTLSNFWLEAYPLMSFAFGMARLAVELASDSVNGKKYIEAFTSAVDMKDIQEAINENSYDLAYKNFMLIEPLLKQVVPDFNCHYPISKGNLPEFHYFLAKVDTDGLKHFFKDDPVKHWCELPEGHGGGFYDFLAFKIKPMMLKEKEDKEKKKA